MNSNVEEIHTSAHGLVAKLRVQGFTLRNMGLKYVADMEWALDFRGVHWIVYLNVPMYEKKSLNTRAMVGLKVVNTDANADVDSLAFEVSWDIYNAAAAAPAAASASASIASVASASVAVAEASSTPRKSSSSTVQEEEQEQEKETGQQLERPTSDEENRSVAGGLKSLSIADSALSNGHRVPPIAEETAAASTTAAAAAASHSHDPHHRPRGDDSSAVHVETNKQQRGSTAPLNRSLSASSAAAPAIATTSTSTSRPATDARSAIDTSSSSVGRSTTKAEVSKRNSAPTPSSRSASASSSASKPKSAKQQQQQQQPQRGASRTEDEERGELLMSSAPSVLNIEPDDNYQVEFTNEEFNFGNHLEDGLILRFCIQELANGRRR